VFLKGFWRLQTGIDALGEQARDESLINFKSEDVPAARHRFDVLRWYVGKRAPKRWGDKVEVRQEISGPNGQPIAIDVLHSILLKPEVLERLNETQIEALRSAISLLAAPAAASAAPVVDGEFSEVTSTETDG
jgi:hypothetical protein